MAGSPLARSREGPAALLIVDSDLSFCFWLGHALDRSGYVSLPARDTRAAAELAYSSPIEALIIDPQLFDAIAFVLHLRRLQPELKAIAAAAPEASGSPQPPIYDGVLVKPLVRSAAEAEACVAIVRGVSPPPRRDSRGARV